MRGTLQPNTTEAHPTTQLHRVNTISLVIYFLQFTFSLEDKWPDLLKYEMTMFIESACEYV